MAVPLEKFARTPMHQGTVGHDSITL